MKKKIILIIVIIIVVLGVVVYWFFIKEEKTEFTLEKVVHERIKEIGIMKAVGAKNKNIITIFLIESGFFGLFGGLGGMVLGLGLAKAVEFAVKTTGNLYLQASITPKLIVFSLGFSFFTWLHCRLSPCPLRLKTQPSGCFEV